MNTKPRLTGEPIMRILCKTSENRMRRFRPIDFAIAARLSTAWAWHCELVGESWTRSF